MPNVINKLTEHYPALIEHCRSGANTIAIWDWLRDQLGVHMHKTHLRTILYAWADAGALRQTDSRPYTFYATARAMEPSTMVAALGPVGAAMHGVNVAPQPPQGSLRSQAVEAVQLPHHTIHAAPQVAQVPPGPLSLFRAEFTTQGLVIPYEEVPGLIAMLDAVMTDRGR
jgi:hypothetical protein